MKSDDKAEVLIPHVDQLLVVTSLQLRMAFSKHMADNDTDKKMVVSLYRCLLAMLVSVRTISCSSVCVAECVL